MILLFLIFDIFSRKAIIGILELHIHAAYLPNTLNIAKELVYEYDLKSNFTFLTCKTLSNRTGNNPLPSLMRANNISTITLTVFSSSIF